MANLTEEQLKIGLQLLDENCEGNIILWKGKFYHVVVWEKHKVWLLYSLQLDDGSLETKTKTINPCSFDEEDEDSDIFLGWLQHVKSMKKTSSEYKHADVNEAMRLTMEESLAYHMREDYYTQLRNITHALSCS